VIEILWFAMNKLMKSLIHLKNFVKKRLKSSIETSNLKVLKVWVHCFSMQVVINKCFLLNPEKNFVHCFSMQVVINKCFLLNPEKNFGADPSCHFREKCTFNFKI